MDAFVLDVGAATERHRHDPPLVLRAVGVVVQTHPLILASEEAGMSLIWVLLVVLLVVAIVAVARR